MKFFDERAGRYRYKHKGSGLVRDTLMVIGKSFAKNATQSLKKAVEKATVQAAEKVAAQAVEKRGKEDSTVAVYKELSNNKFTPG